MTYKELLTEAADMRVNINNEMWPQFKDLAARFKALFGNYGFKPGDFKLISDLVYYQGGWPTENTKAKEQALAEKVATALKLEKAIGRETLRMLLEEQGVTVEAVAAVGDDSSRQQLKDMVDAAQRLQKEICEAADSIKEDMAERAKSEFSIEPKNFIKAVNIAAVGDRDKIREKVEAVEKSVANLDAAMEPLK